MPTATRLVAQLIASAGLLAFLLFLQPLIALPKVALGAISFLTAFGMLEVASLRTLRRIDRNEFSIAVGVTVILIAGMVPGILAGLLLSLIDVLYEIPALAMPSCAVCQATGSSMTALIRKKARRCGAYRLPLVCSAYLANARYVVARIREIVDQAGPELEWLVIGSAGHFRYRRRRHNVLPPCIGNCLKEHGVQISCDTPLPVAIAQVGLSSTLGSRHFYVSSKKAS